MFFLRCKDLIPLFVVKKIKKKYQSVERFQCKKEDQVLLMDFGDDDTFKKKKEEKATYN
jgi:hypothetical protein